MTAAFSGTGYLAKKQLAKYAEKQVAKKLGTELCERLLKDGADSQAVAKAIKALEKAGTSEALIRKAAGELTTAEFERIGKLAKRGLAQELLERVIDNRAVLGNVSDSTLLLFKNSAKSYDDIITMLTRHGDAAGQLYGLYGDDVIGVALKYGDEAVDAYVKYGDDAACVLESGKSAKGLIGHDFENYLSEVIGGNGSFSIGGRDFDGGIGNRWWEAKSGNYWNMLEENPNMLEKFKSDMGDRLRIATENGATYELFSNTPIPESIKQWLTKKGIAFTELLD